MNIKDYYGWRARIGLIYVSDLTVMEPELAAMAPEGVSIHTTRARFNLATVETVTESMATDEIERCTSLLADAPLHSIILGGTALSFVRGLGWDVEVCKRMSGVSNGIPVTTASTAIVNALRALGAKKVAYAAPYTEEFNVRAQAFLVDNGFEVVSAAGMELDTNEKIAAVPTGEVYAFTQKSVSPDADAVFMSCTGWRTAGAIEPLEQTLGKPVVTSVQASFWHALRLARCEAEVRGFGRLFAI